MIKSRFGISTYLILFFITLFLAFPVYFVIHPDIVINNRSGKGNSAPALATFLFIASLIFFFVCARIIYFIKIENETISVKGLFKNKRIELTDIKSINLFSKEDFYWTAGSATIATRIELNDGNKIVIADPFYRNTHLLKQVLAENFKEKIRPLNGLTSSAVAQTELEDDFSRFAGNPNTSLNGLLFYGVTIFFLFAAIKTHRSTSSYWVLTIAVLLFYLGFGMQLNYFLLSNKHLVVKNHFLFWINKTYEIKDIAAIDFETPYRRSKALRIMTGDFKSKLFCAGSLRDKDWGQLAKKIRSLQITLVE